MKRGGGRQKGSSFERQVAKVFQTKFCLDPKDCYRTPLSGGHYAASRNDPGDLVFSPAFLRTLPVPLCIECKNQKNWKIGRFWENLRAKKSWPETQALTQVIKTSGLNAAPMLIFKYHQDKEIWCCITGLFHYAKVRSLRFKFRGIQFHLAKLDTVLDSWVAHDLGKIN